MMTLNLGNLATFRLVVQRGSFSAAADVLGLSQPAVSLQVRQLEQFLQTRLLERTGRGIKATAAGIALLAHSEQIELAVRVTVGNTLEVVRAIEENRLDLGLCTLPANGRSLAVMPVLEEEFVCIFSDGQDELPWSLTPEILQSLPLIAFESGSGTRDLIDGWFLADGRAVAPVMQLGSIEAIKRMVRAGLGFSIVPRMAVEHPQDRIGLNVQSLTPLLHRQLGIIMRQDKIISKGIAEILRLLQKLENGQA
ncbi:LysR family transcriptional regulator [Klebsiella oxytoca]|nr:LysR family transcriptional regulator [Klebsiella oxytoca]MDU3468857.1 LysR family transcriptional regulator [Klebsiella oxytoca]